MKTKLRLHTETYHSEIAEAAKLLRFSTAQEAYDFLQKDCSTNISGYKPDEDYLLHVKDMFGNVVCLIEEVEIHELSNEDDVFGDIAAAIGKQFYF